MRGTLLAVAFALGSCATSSAPPIVGQRFVSVSPRPPAPSESSRFSRSFSADTGRDVCLGTFVRFLDAVDARDADVLYELLAPSLRIGPNGAQSSSEFIRRLQEIVVSLPTNGARNGARTAADFDLARARVISGPLSTAPADTCVLHAPARLSGAPRALELCRALDLCGSGALTVAMTGHDPPRISVLR